MSDEVEAHAPSRGGDGSDDRLERRYRRLLTVLPKDYRASRGEEMLSVLMDGAPEERRWPAASEVLSLAALGIRVRSGARPGELQTTESALPLLRAIALTGSLLFTFLAGLDAVRVSWQWSYFASDVNFSDLDGHGHTYDQEVWLRVAGLLWPAAYAAVTLGLRRTTYLFAALLTVYTAVQVSGTYTALAALPAVIVVIAMVVATRSGLARAASPGRWLAGLGVLMALCGVVDVIDVIDTPWYPSTAWNAPLVVLLFGVPVVFAAALSSTHSAAWPLALALVQALNIGLDLDRLHHERFLWPTGLSHDGGLLTLTFLEGCLIAIAAAALLRRRGPHARRVKEAGPPA